MKKYLLTVLRIAVGLGLIAYLLITADLGEFVILMRSWRVEYFVVAVLLGLLRNVTFAYRWRATLSAGGVKVPLLKLIRLYLVAGFFNLVLPTALGGDVVRGYGLVSRLDDKLSAATSVLVERIIGLLTLTCVALTSLLLGGDVMGLSSGPLLWILAGTLIGIVVIVLALDAPMVGRAVGRIRSVGPWEVGPPFQRVYVALRQFVEQRRRLWPCFLLSIISQVLAILAIWALASAISLDVAPLYFFIVVPMIWVVTMIPVSVNGLGLREGAYVFFFARAGVSESAALLLAFLDVGRLLALGLVGGVVYVFGQAEQVGQRASVKPIAKDDLYG